MRKEKKIMKKETIMNIQQIELNQEQKDVLIGTLLGDGWLETTTNGRTYRYGFKQKLSQQSYVLNIYDVFKDLCGSKPRRNNTDFQFKTLTKSVLSTYGKLFYGPVHKKKVPSNINDLLTPRALAYWFMDDGSKEKKNSAIIATNNFNKQDVELLCFVLKNKFGLVCRPKQQKRQTGKIE